jgi:hypothetical protein
VPGSFKILLILSCIIPHSPGKIEKLQTFYVQVIRTYGIACIISSLQVRNTLRDVKALRDWQGSNQNPGYLILSLVSSSQA